MSRTVIFVWSDNSIVGTDPEHMFGRLGGTSVNGEGIIVLIDSAEVGKASLGRRFNFPILNQILHQIFETSSGMV